MLQMAGGGGTGQGFCSHSSRRRLKALRGQPLSSLQSSALPLRFPQASLLNANSSDLPPLLIHDPQKCQLTGHCPMSSISVLPSALYTILLDSENQLLNCHRQLLLKLYLERTI